MKPGRSMRFAAHSRCCTHVHSSLALKTLRSPVDTKANPRIERARFGGLHSPRQDRRCHQVAPRKRRMIWFDEAFFALWLAGACIRIPSTLYAVADFDLVAQTGES